MIGELKIRVINLLSRIQKIYPSAKASSFVNSIDFENFHQCFKMFLSTIKCDPANANIWNVKLSVSNVRQTH